MVKTFVSLASFVIVSAPLLARAQIYEAVGTRAQGMGGAFVAVADDASATWWNPAGLATGSYFSGIIERDSNSDPGTPAAAGPAGRDTATGVAVAFPALGLSYYSLRVSEIRPASAAPSTASGASGRQDEGVQGVGLSSFSASKFGVTIGQSIGRNLVVASTLGLIHGGVATGSDAASGSQALDDADGLGVPSETHADVDLGAMLAAGSLRVGASVKHVTEPHFGDGDAGISLDRQARAGIAVVSKSGAHAVTVAADLDLTRTATVNGDVRHVAGGVEGWFAKRRLGLRGGVSANLVGSARPAPSAGVSLAVKSGLYLDGAATFGSDQSRKGWALALRATL
jgi:hypothetical protein